MCAIGETCSVDCGVLRVSTPLLSDDVSHVVGVMFTIKAKSEILIRGLNFQHKVGTPTITVWMKSGTYVGYETAGYSGGWYNIKSLSLSLQSDVYVQIDFDLEEWVTPGNSVSFYVQSSMAGLKSGPLSVGNPAASDRNIEFVSPGQQMSGDWIFTQQQST